MSVEILLRENDFDLYLNAVELKSSNIDSEPGNPLFIGTNNATNMLLNNVNSPIAIRGNVISFILSPSGQMVLPNATDPNTAYSFSSSQAELNLTYSLSGAYTQANAGSLKIRRIGNWVDIYIKQSVYANVINPGSGLNSNVIIPVNYRPLTAQLYPCIIKDNGSNILNGLMSINTDGTFQINILSSNWTSGNQAGLINFAISYPIA
jgi:hypothetical protein